MRVLAVRNCALEGFGRYRTLLRQHGAQVTEVRPFEGEPLPAAADFDVLLVGGTPLAAYAAENHEFLRREMAFLEPWMAADRPCLGICCGAQLMARVLGAAVGRHDRMQIGVFRGRLTDCGAEDPVFSALPHEFPILHWHGDAFDLPPGARHTVSSAGCEFEAFRHGRAVGLQFHLELPAAALPAWVAAYPQEPGRAGTTGRAAIEAARAADAELAQQAERFVDALWNLWSTDGPAIDGGSPAVAAG